MSPGIRWTRVEFMAFSMAMVITSLGWSVLAAQEAKQAAEVEIQAVPEEQVQVIPAPLPPGARPVPEKPATGEKKPEPKPVGPPIEAKILPGMDADSIRFYLMDGSVITGKLSLKELAVETQYGSLNVPVASIRSFTPGLSSHPNFSKQVASWIQALGSSNFNEREKAQQQLERYPNLRPLLEKHQADSDTERRNRVIAILNKFEEETEEGANQDAWKIQERDVIETVDFTIVGKIVPQSFTLASQYGPLTIQLADIRRGQRDLSKKEDIRQTISVDGSNFAYKNPLNTNIRLERGDKVTIVAEGTIQMQPWGNGASASPEGNQQYGWFMGNQIPMCALIGKVGANDQFFKIGSRYSTTIEKSGVLQLALGMNNDYNESQFPGKFSVKIVVVKRAEQ
jgi:hypothetical protein